ncbi:ribosomal protein S17 [Cordyceps fumosorosea ARSEF 2679]|uniref:Ribosomal protein S17 n=1 Tax=Cordyceps fumosorosea (strain ARSEF 2679) TaxID=1081104 RepID=A0A168EG89_CORFA|nr:ribosomal protein S17 [Cordyceps fumosorosea ARSEF 2679]OAA73770.1 ribosomal protein S17 [Cordyceps fumosorosea ARSEF 2679]
MSSQVSRAARRVTHELHGIVVSAGLMQKTVKVRVAGQKWNKIVNKFYGDPKHYLVHDPNSSLRTGDVVAIAPGWPTSRHKRHVVKQIIAPFGEPIESRPAVPSLDEIIAERETKKAAKDERKAQRKQSEEEQRLALKKATATERESKRTAWEQLKAKSGQ